MPSSDIDLMVIGEVDMDALDRAIDSIEEELSRTVNYTLFDVEEWRERVRQGHSFVADVLTHDKIFLIGDEDDLSALGTGGLIEPYQVPLEEIRDLLDVARRDVKTAEELMNIDLDWAPIVAYNAALQAGLAFMYAKGTGPEVLIGTRL